MKKLFTLLCCLCLFSTSFAAIIRVDINVVGGANNGTSWLNAYSTLSAALGVAVSGDQVWVANGTYIPGANATDIFLIPSGVSVYGGFASGEASLAARNIAVNIAILSGNSVCNHVVGFNNVTAATRLDGFTITGSSGGIMGGGIYNLGGGTNVTIQSCIIKQNAAGQGGGMCNDGTASASNPIIKSCTFSQNTGGQGGGVFNYGPAGNVGGTYTSCVFDNNGTGQGSGMFTYVYNGGTSTLSFTNCEFKNHTSNYYAFDCNGSNSGTTQVSFSSCTFTNNSSGAIFNNNYNSTNNNTLTLTNCTFTQNGGTNYYYPYGGAVGIYAQQGKCTPTVSGCTFTKNGGRAFYNDGSSSGQCSGSFTNCQFTENYGTALYNYGSYGKSNQTVSGCTFSKNGTDSNADAALYNHGDNGEAVCVVSNCTFSENNRGALYNYRNFKGTARPTFTNCTFSKNAGGYYGGAVYNNGNGDYCPAFTDCKFLDNATTGDGAAVYNYFDNSSSAKNNTTFLRCTFTGNTSSNNGGAVYNNFSGIVSVSFTDCILNNNKATVSYSNGGAMVNYVNSGATGALTVTNCKFNQNQAGNLGGGVFNNGASISMAYANCTFNKNKLTNSNGSNGGGGVYNFRYNGNEALSYTDCQFNDNESNAFGGGIVNNGYYASYNVQYLRCTINNNKTIGSSSYNSSGGGICNFSMGDYPTLTDCFINGNSATYIALSVSKYAEGGGIYNNGSYPTLTNCTINSNKGSRGGGFYNISGSTSGKETKLINCSIRGNEAIANSDPNSGDGGGVGNHDSNMTLLNCLIAGNSATDEGGGILSAYYGGYTTIINCTISGNKAGFAGGIFYNTTPTNLKNTIVWGNSTQIEGYHDENLTFDYSLVQGLNPAGTGNLNGTLAVNNPQFISPANFSSAPTLLGNYRLSFCSPAINVGNDAANSSTTDLDGNARKFGIIDLGAYEFKTLQIIATASTPTPTVCFGSSFSLTAGGGNTFSWTGPSGSGFGSTAQNPSLTASSTSFGGVYTVKVSNTGCTVTATATVSVQVNPVPTAIPSSNSPICTGQTLQLSSNAGGSGYSWAATGFSSTEQSPSRSNSTTAMSGVYSFSIANSFGCTTTATINVNVYPAPNLSASSNSPLCEGKTLQLSASGGSSYTWEATGFSSTLQNPNRTNATTGMSGDYKVSLVNGSCTITATAMVSVQVIPSFTLSLGFAPICVQGNPLNLSVSGGDHYAWKGPNGFQSTSATPTKAKTVAKDEGIYSVTATGNTVCSVTSTIQVYYGIGAGGISITNRSPYCKGGPIQLSATAAGASSYSWTKQLGSSTYTGNPVTITNNAKTSDGGMYILFVTGQNGCVEKQETIVTVSPVACIGTRMASDEAEDMDMQINAYPNPVTNTLTVEVTLKEPSKLRLQLYNSIGKESGIWQLNEETTVHKTELNMSELTGGVYLLQAQAGKQKVVKRVVKVQN